MVSTEELQRLKAELMNIASYIAEQGTDEEYRDSTVTFAANGADALDWVLGAISTEHFLSAACLDIGQLKTIAHHIEARTGTTLAEYE